jgi:DNA end-binding protein Ku
VVLTKDDFKTAALQKTKTVDILDFVDADEIDERYFETPYYLQPGKGADRSYALLREAIRESGRTGIGKIILREAQHLAAIEVIGDAIVLTMMRFADELADLEDFKFPSSEGIRKPELTMARQLVESLSAEWDPSKYTDEYRDSLIRVIKGKLAGRKPRLREREDARGADVIDLMSRLKASLEERGGRETSRRRAASKQEGRARHDRKQSAATGRKKAHKTPRVA